MRFKNWVKPEIREGQFTKWNWVVQHAENLQLGERTDIGMFTYINAKHGVIIKDDVQIGSHCSIYTESTIDNKSGRIILEKNCKIGTHSTIMPSVTVGENAIVGAYSFVKKNVPANCWALGIPAKILCPLFTLCNKCGRHIRVEYKDKSCEVHKK